jgi:hypothetical protein
MSGREGGSALRSDPDEVLRLSLHAADAVADGERFIAALENQFDDYDRSHRGPDVEVIVNSGLALIDGLRASMVGLPDLAVALRSAEAELAALQAESEALRREMEALTPTDETPEVAADLSRRFANIRASEDAVFDRLAAAITSAGTGHDVPLDMAAVIEVIGRDASSIRNVDIRSEVDTALALAADYADDGDFDTAPPVGWDDDAVMIDLPDPGPTGDWDGWWLWREFKPADFDAESMAGLDATPGLGTGSDPTAVTPINARQGSIGDCYFVSAVSSLANTASGRKVLQEMVVPNGDGTYTVAFGDGVEVTVDSDIYVNDDGSPAYGGSAEDEFNWFSVLEKGYAVRTENSYDEIEGGWAAPSWELLLGEGEATRIREPSAEELTTAVVEDLGADEPAALAFDLNDINETVFSDSSLHEFSVLSIDEAAGEITIRNPWGSNGSLEDGLENDYGATVGEDGIVTVPIDNLAPIIHTYESYETEQS